MNRLQKEALYCMGFVFLLVLLFISIWQSHWSNLYLAVLIAIYYVLKPRFLGDPKDEYESDELEIETLLKASDISKTTMVMICVLGFIVCGYFIPDHNKALDLTYNHIGMIFILIIAIGHLIKSISLFILINYYQKPQKPNKDKNE